MFAGEKSKPAADASYSNLSWENFHVDHSFDFGTKIQGNKEIGTIDSWGPFFRVSFDLIQHSPHDSVHSVLEIYPIGIYLAQHQQLIFMTMINENVNPSYCVFFIETSRWYNIVIEQKAVNGKVIRYILDVIISH